MFRQPRISLAAVVTGASFSLVSMTLPGMHGTTRAMAAERLRIHARTSLVNVGLTRGAEWVEVTGSVQDDAELPVADARVELTGANGGTVATTTCGQSAEPGALAGQTNAAGVFCLRFSATEGEGPFGLRYGGNEFREGASAAVPREPSHGRLVLSIEPPPDDLDLDSPASTVNVTTRVVDSVAGAPLHLVLSFRREENGPKEVELGAAFVPAGSQARFNVETRLLAPPGRGVLVVRAAGSGTLGPAEATCPVQTRATVTVTLAASPPASDPSDGVPILCGVTSRVGMVESGWVEASFDSKPVGIAPVSQGAARVIATFAGPRSPSARVALRYVPSGPGFVAGPPETVDVALAKPSAWRSLPWLLMAGAALYTVVRAWRRPPKRLRARTDARAARGFASIDLLEGGAGASGWRGRVLDAREATPIAGAAIQIVVPRFDGEGVARRTRTAEDGTFDIAPLEIGPREAARWEVRAPTHAALSEPLPPEGTLAVSLVSRRRALLDRLVRWASRAGRAQIRGREPTPGDVAGLGEDEQRADVAAWASAVERAAYGEIPPDERQETALVGVEPLLPERPGARRALTSEKPR